MKPRRQTSPTLILVTSLCCLAVLALSLLNFDTYVSNAQGQVQVTASDPALAEQGTINLNVKVTGKGFKNGAKAKWQVTGTTDTGGVTVNSTTFVSSSELTANITVDESAAITTFDIQVTNSDGRGGKGTELFRVTAKQAKIDQCPPKQPAPTSDTKCYANLPGCLDSTFGSGQGFVRTHPGDSTSIRGMVRQTDGKIVLTGTTQSSQAGSGPMVMRYNADGSLDTTFGDPDLSTPPLRLGFAVSSSNPSGTAYGIVLQPDGKVVVVADEELAGDSLVLRYNTNGTFDTAFGNGGVSRVSFGRKGSPNQAIALQSDGKIVVTGSSDSTMALARLLPDGSLDPSFGSNGKLTATPQGSKGGSSFARTMLIQRVPAITGEERIVVGGDSLLSSGIRQWTLMRFKPSGAVDTTFGTNGIVKTGFAGFGDSLKHMSLDSNNRIIAVGVIQVADTSVCGTYAMDYGVARYLENGVLDPSFQKQTIDVYGGFEQTPVVTVQLNDKPIIAGVATSSDITVFHAAIVRLNVDGSRDFTFGLLGNGVVTTDFYGKNYFAAAITIDPTNGQILVAGSSSGPLGGNLDAILARYLP